MQHQAKLLSLLTATKGIIGRVRQESVILNASTAAQREERAAAATLLRALALILIKRDAVATVPDDVLLDVIQRVEEATGQVGGRVMLGVV